MLELKSVFRQEKSCGDGGYRSPYLSHAKRALYHLSYVPCGGCYCTGEGNYWLKKARAVNFGRYNLVCVCTTVSLDSSVGRAVDCSCDCQTSIGRWFKSGSREFFWSFCLFVNSDMVGLAEKRLRQARPPPIPR